MGTNIAIFASGSGSNALKIMEHFKQKPEVATVQLLVANKADIGAITHASTYGVPSVVITNLELKNNPARLTQILRAQGIQFIALAGFLAKIPAEVTQTFAGRMLNIHPSLLPLYGGKGMYGIKVHEAAIADGAKESGITIHEVNEVYDDGKIIHQAKVAVDEYDTPESLQAKVLKLEHAWYPLIIERAIKGLNA